MPMSIAPTPDLQEYEHGLVRSANRPPDLGGRWENGVGVSLENHLIINGMCSTCSAPGTKSAQQTCAPSVTFFPYLLEYGVYEGTGDQTPDEVREMAEDLMEIGTSARLEDLQVVGCTGTDNPVLADGTALAAGANAAEAVGLIVQYFYDADLHIGARGTIYMSPVDYVDHGFDVTSEQNGVLRTKFGGHKVIVGNYPSGTVYGHLGEVDLYLSEIFVTSPDVSVLTNNIVRFRVERLAMPVWDTAHTVKVAIS